MATIDDLTNSTTALLNAVNVSKATLDASVASAASVVANAAPANAIYAERYSTLALADAAAVAAGKTLVISTQWGTVPAVINAEVDVRLGGEFNTDVTLLGNAVIKPAWFGAKASIAVDDTLSIQRAHNNSHASIEYLAGRTYKTGTIQVKGNPSIIGNGCTIHCTGSGVFNAVVAAPKLHIHGFTVTWASGAGITGRQFFWNGNNAAGSTAYGATVNYPIKDLRVYNNELGASKVECFGLTTQPRVYDNSWEHDSSVNVAPAYLYIERGTTDDNAGPVWVKDNFFDVYPPAGSAVTIVKISGGITDAKITGNHVHNRNNASAGHFNVFTGAHKMRFTGNTLINSQVHRKQVQGGIAAAPTLYQCDLLSGNTFEFKAGSFDTTSIYAIGSLATITQNQFINHNVTSAGKAIHLDISDVDCGFDTNAAVAMLVSQNIFDLRGTPAGSTAVLIATSNLGAHGARFMNISGNVQLGGSYFVQGGSETFSSIFGNVWGNSGSATGNSLNAGGPNNSVIGNVFDTTTPLINGNTSGNIGTMDIPTLETSATPNVSASNTFLTSGSTITDFLGGQIGKKITLFTAGGATVVHGNNIKLNGAVNFVFATYGDSLTLQLTTATRWVEVGRSKN